MSADNGVYILETRDQYRVVHAQAFYDNLYYTFDEEYQRRNRNIPVPTRILEYYGNTRYTRDSDTALRVANAIANRTPCLEYGIQTLYINKTWKQIVAEAKALAPKEIAQLKEQNKPRQEWKVKELENILSS